MHSKIFSYIPGPGPLDVSGTPQMCIDAARCPWGATPPPAATLPVESLCSKVIFAKYQVHVISCDGLYYIGLTGQIFVQT